MNCQSCGVKFDFQDCLTNPGHLPDNDSCGICYKCGMWWAIEDGKQIEYFPSKEQTEMVYAKMPESRKRAMEAYRKEKTK